jgi:hypothetical protein
MPACALPYCKIPSRTSGLCSGHYQQKYGGKPFTPLLARRSKADVQFRDASGRKQCVKCRGWLPEGEFSSGAASDGLQQNCRTCGKSKKLLQRFNLTERQYQELLAEQGGVCAACGSECRHGKRLAVDHDHSCCPGYTSCGNCIRGLICISCNSALGNVYDSIPTLLGMVGYLRKWEERK